MAEIEEVDWENCLQRLAGGRRGRCSVNFNPEKGSPAYKDLSPEAQKYADEGRYGPCEPGAHCRPKYKSE